MDINAALIILAPVLGPLTQSVNMDPVHAGIMIVLALTIGLMTPAVGVCLFMVCSIAKMNEVQKYPTLSGHLFAPYVWVMNKAFYDGLTPQEKVVLNDAVKSSIVAGRDVARAIEASDRGMAALSKEMQVNALTADQRAKFRDLTMPEVKKIIVEKQCTEGEAMMKALLEAIAAALN
jgi:TRAP-type C4-dicarboxylate transport system substrate-binding protein